VLFFSLICLPGFASAAAWPQPEGHGLEVLTFSWYQTGSIFTERWTRQPLSKDGRFFKHEVNNYIEYGLTDRITLVGNFFYNPTLHFSDQTSNVQSSGFGDQEFAVRYGLNSGSSPMVWSIQGLVKIPTYTLSRNPPPGLGQTDYEIRLLNGHGWDAYGKHLFWNVEGAYRYRTQFPADEFRLDATIGADPFPRWTILAQMFTIKGFRNGELIAIPGNPTLNPNFDLIKGQLSVVYRVTTALRVQVGGSAPVAGRNTGAGAGVLLSIWWDF
jgi:hypothetical protein